MDNNYNNDNNQQNMSTDPYAQGGGYVQDPYNNGGGLQPQGGKGKAIASMVLGIVGIVFGCCVYTMWISLITGIIGVALGAISRKKNEDGKGMAIAGIVCSIIAIVFGSICIILVATGSTAIGLSALGS